MSSAWLLPEHIADVLPAQARQVEDLRRRMLDTARSYGYELVIPPLMEYLESLLSGAGESLHLKTFKLIDQLSGRTLGVRADATPQVARIDAHLLNRAGVTRLCYCGPVLHTLVTDVQATREPLQFGAEVYGHQGLEADLEILDLALDCASQVPLHGILLDLGDARILEALWPWSHKGLQAEAHAEDVVRSALARKDGGALVQLTRDWPDAARQALLALVHLYGDPEAVLTQARSVLKPYPRAVEALNDLAWLLERIRRTHPEAAVSLDLADLGGSAYYTGLRFTVYAERASSALIRGGRYDAIGAVFGRDRPAVGLGLDLKALLDWTGAAPQCTAIRAPSDDTPALRQAIRDLRQQGHIVFCVLPGHEHEVQEFECDRELVECNGQWQTRRL